VNCIVIRAIISMPYMLGIIALDELILELESRYCTVLNRVIRWIFTTRSI
jgi:hypothetical protein